jgi:hypothetical protein
VCIVIMLVICAIGMLAVGLAAVFLVRETTSTIDMLAAEERSIVAVAPEALQAKRS